MRKKIIGSSLSTMLSALSFFVAILLVLSFPAGAQPPGKAHRIGFLLSTSRSSMSTRIDSFRQRLRELGYVEGQNIAIEYRSAEGKLDRLPDLPSS